MSCIFTRCTYDKKFGDDQAISSRVTALSAFLVLAPWRPSQESDRDQNLVCTVISPRFRSIAPAVMKRALLMGDDDGQHVI
jgi:hypothetical protein